MNAAIDSRMIRPPTSAKACGISRFATPRRRFSYGSADSASMRTGMSSMAESSSISMPPALSQRRTRLGWNCFGSGMSLAKVRPRYTTVLNATTVASRMNHCDVRTLSGSTIPPAARIMASRRIQGVERGPTSSVSPALYRTDTSQTQPARRRRRQVPERAQQPATWPSTHRARQ